jgi:hypothetical protein
LTDTAERQETIPRGQLNVITEDVFKIMMPAEKILKRLSINFGQNRKVCEVIVAGISAGKFS